MKEHHQETASQVGEFEEQAPRCSMTISVTAWLRPTWVRSRALADPIEAAESRPKTAATPIQMIQSAPSTHGTERTNRWATAVLWAGDRDERCRWEYT